MRMACVFVAICLLACAGIDAGNVKQEQPTNNSQCFEGKVNPFLFNSWPLVARDGNVFYIKNPNNTQPKFVAILIYPPHHIVGYAYLDNDRVVFYELTENDGKYCYNKSKKPIDEGAKNFIEKRLRQLGNGKAC